MSWTEDMKSAAAGAATGGIVGAASSVASGLLANRQQKKLLKMQQDFQRSEREASQRWQEDQWRAQTLYNSPIATMNRLREAGLSPDMMYQNGSISAMMSSEMPSAPSGSAPSVPTPAGTGSFNQAAEQVTDVAKTVAEVKNIEANTRKQEKETEQLNMLIEHEGVKIMLTGEQLDFTKEQKELCKAKVQTEFAQAAKFRSAIEVDGTIAALNKQQLYECKQTFKDRFEQLRLNNRSTDLHNRLTEKELNAFEEFMEATIDLMNDQAFEAQQQGKALSLANIDTQRIQEARSKIKAKYLGGESSFYDVMAQTTLALMIGDVETVQEQLELLKGYGAWTAITDPIATVLGAAAGAYVGARTNKAPIKPQGKIGFKY